MGTHFTRLPLSVHDSFNGAGSSADGVDEDDEDDDEDDEGEAAEEEEEEEEEEDDDDEEAEATEGKADDDDNDAQINNTARVKEMTENADAKAHQHEEREDDPETGSGLVLVDRGAAMAAGHGVLPATGHEGSAKRRRVDHTCLARPFRSRAQSQTAKEEPPKKVNKRQEEKAPGLEEEDSDREHRLTCAELRCAQYRLKKCLENQDYTKAAAIQKNAALMSGEPSVEKGEKEEADGGGGEEASGRASLCPG